MRKLLSFFFFSTVCLHQAWTNASKCVELSEESGNITEFYAGPQTTTYNRCWNWSISDPENLPRKIELKHLDFQSKHCYYVYLTIKDRRTGNELKKWCYGSSEPKSVTVYTNVTISFYVGTYELKPNDTKNFELFYTLDRSIEGVKGIEDAKRKSKDWLKESSFSSKWIKHIPKSVTALALSGWKEFNAEDQIKDLMIKQAELRISLALLRDSVSSEQMSSFINFVLLTCHSPHSYYGYNMVKLLQDQINTENFTHPAAYLALCNADEKWPEKAYGELYKTIEDSSNLTYKRDLQAFAIMALSCKIRRTGNHTTNLQQQIMQRLTLEAYEAIIQKFKGLQQASGSFGNVHRTALMTQALIASDRLSDKDWKPYKAVKYLITSAPFPKIDFISSYLTLPVLHSKSLVDIGFTKCSKRRNEDDTVHEVLDYVGLKIEVKYTLFIEDEAIYSIVLKVPKYYTALDVMKFAALKNEQFRFEYELESGKSHIYEIATISNDPEEGKFWLFYLRKTAAGEAFSLVTTDPAETTLTDGDHIAMWYKTPDYFHT